MVAMGEFGLDQADLAEVTTGDHRLHVPHQRIAGVAVIDGADPAGGAGGADDVLALFDRHGHRLFTENMKARFEKGLGDLVMGGVGGGDGDQVDAVFARFLAVQHLAPVAIGAVRFKAQPLAIVTAGLGAVIERAGCEFEFAVKARAEPVGRADLAAFAAADHAPFELCHGQVLAQKPMD
jgi:hypothetical protein